MWSIPEDQQAEQHVSSVHCKTTDSYLMFITAGTPGLEYVYMDGAIDKIRSKASNRPLAGWRWNSRYLEVGTFMARSRPAPVTSATLAIHS